jgi:transcriptional regulator with XRE-family HTH domain
VVNWEEIKREWETTKITLKALAEKHGVKIGTLKSRKSREGWSRDGPGKKDATKQKKVATSVKKDATISNHISWVEIENEYVTDIRKKPCTLKELAKKYNISISRIEKYAAENEWAEKRRKYAASVQKKTAEKTAEIISDELSIVTARHLRVSDKLIDIIEKALEDENELYKYVEKLRQGYGPGEFEESIVVDVKDALNDSKLVNIVNSLDKLQKMQRQTLGILDAKDQHKVEMDKRKMGDADEEFEDDGFLEALNGTVEEVWDDET